MDAIAAELRKSPTPVAGSFSYGWIHVGIAALAMVGTLPGRTQGLGLITEPLIGELKIGRVEFAQINLWATLLGALFAPAAGRLLDRWGSRIVLTVVAALLGAVVLVMSNAHAVILVCMLITLTRGLGQSALSVVSITLVGQWFRQRLNLAMGVYTVALSIGFMLAFPLVGAVVLQSGWRTAWTGIGAAILFGLAPLSWFLVRRGPEVVGLQVDGQHKHAEQEVIDSSEAGHTLRQALGTPAFWIFALASSLYGLIASGISLFNESILAERGFAATTYHRTLVITALTALVGNFIGGWLAGRWSLGRMMGAAMLLLTGALAVLPSVRTEAHVSMWAVAMGLVGGAVMVVFFTFWGRAFGRAHLGKIQGAAQTLTVVASAVGPLLLAQCVTLTGSYSTMFYVLAVMVFVLGVCAWFVPVPSVTESDQHD